MAVNLRGALLRTLIVAPLLSLVLVLGGFTTALGTSLFVQVNGVAGLLPRHATLLALTGPQGISPTAGAQFDVAGDALDLRGGERGSVDVNGVTQPEANELPDGATIVTRRGRDRTETLVKLREKIPFETLTEGSGPVLSLTQTGQPGAKEIFLGTVSRRQAGVFVVQAPVATVISRKSALDPGQKAVALTFDDGPSEYTELVAAALLAKHAPATFFCLGQEAAGNEAEVAKLRGEGFEIANHSWNHPRLTELSKEEVRTQITRTDAVLGETRFFRPPYGSYDATVVAQATETGHQVVLWDVDTRDWESRDAKKILGEVKAQVRPGAVILMHDGGGDRSQTAAALPEVVDWLLSEGYAIAPLATLRD